jgi:hypothetical protein
VRWENALVRPDKTSTKTDETDQGVTIVRHRGSYGEEWGIWGWGQVRWSEEEQISLEFCLATEMYWLFRDARRMRSIRERVKYQYLCEYVPCLFSCLSLWINLVWAFIVVHQFLPCYLAHSVLGSFLDLIPGSCLLHRFLICPSPWLLWQCRQNDRLKSVLLILTGESHIFLLQEITSPSGDQNEV